MSLLNVPGSSRSSSPPERLRLLHSRVLDGLRLVEHKHIPVHALEQLDAQRHGVRRDAQRGKLLAQLVVGNGAPFLVHDPGGFAVEHEVVQVGSELLQLAFPVSQKRCGHDEQRADAAVLAWDLGAQAFEEGEHLKRLAQAHVVCQARPEAEVLQVREPREAGFLVGAQLRVNRCGHGEAFQLRRFAHALEQLVEPLAARRFHEVALVGLARRLAHGLEERKRRVLGAPLTIAAGRGDGR